MLDILTLVRTDGEKGIGGEGGVGGGVGGWQKCSPYQFFPCNFFKRRN